jgi:cystathionine beta-synthase
MKDGKLVGSLDDANVYQLLCDSPELRDTPIASIMQQPFPLVAEDTTIDALSKLISKDVSSVLVELKNGKQHIITRHDLIAAIA